jgi:activator of HSP90 ATPase
VSDSIDMTWTVTDVTAARLWADWLSGTGHSAMTDANAVSEPIVGTTFTAWGGYISGTLEAVEPGTGFTQRWRTLDFPADAAMSLLVVTFADSDEGCVVTVRHTELPEGDGPKYQQGWLDHYAEPMTAHYRELAAQTP